MVIMDRKQQILDVGAELLLVKGFCGFSYQDISERLGITKASIHHHFSSKAALGIAICDHFEAIHAQIVESAIATGGGPKAVIEALLDFGTQMADQGDRCCPGGVLQAEYNSLPEQMRERVDKMFSDFHQQLTAILAEGRQIGQFQFEGSAEDQAWLLISTQQGAMLSSRVNGADIFRAVDRQIRSSLFA